MFEATFSLALLFLYEVGDEKNLLLRCFPVSQKLPEQWKTLSVFSSKREKNLLCIFLVVQTEQIYSVDFSASSHVLTFNKVGRVLSRFQESLCFTKERKS